MSLAAYYNPVKVIHSDSWWTTCEEQIESLDIQKPLVVTFPEGRKWLDLNAKFPSEQIFHEIEPNPTFTLAQDIINISLRGDFDGVLAIGGGSVMDTAKCALAALGTGQVQLAELLTFSDPFSHRVPAIFIPTTHGTGSEVTMWATLWNMESLTKHSLSHPDLYPDVAVLDPALTLTLPLDVSLSTTLDALSHSFEAIWNKNANPTSTRYSIDAIVTILEQVPQLKNRQADQEVRMKLLNAATTAGMAFSNTKTAAAHSISYPLTLYYGVPHGIAASISLRPLLDLNGSAIQPELKEIYRLTNLNGLEELKTAVGRIPEGQLSYRLRDWGIEKGQLGELVNQSFTRGRMNNNIIDLTVDHVQHILEDIY